MKGTYDHLQRLYLLIFLVLALGGCLGVPDGVKPVQGFEVERYLGTWYEIARLDHSFERGLSNVTAEYSLRDDGGVRVINRGFKTSAGKWKEAEGKAYFVDDQTLGKLKVSFFGPFYGAYNVIALDQQAYQWSLVVGPDTDYLWILSRTPVLEQAIVEGLISEAKSHGFDTDKLIWVSQSEQ
jgi:apolipoprotein D and lipocalin family protein